MSAERQKLEEIFAAAIAIRDGADRSAFVANACLSDEDLLKEVQSLIESYDQATALPSVIVSPGQPAIGRSPLVGREQAGVWVGRYRLVEMLGEGGFGEVWVAEQQAPMRRRVAVKLIKPGMDSREVLARFERERQALTLMDHPNIARVFDGGATAGGRPYFVMELVRGKAITTYCDEQRLPVRDRVELFVHVCHAVQHAHQKGVIHRDLKPSNILVTELDGQPAPKVIDFGVAKAIDQPFSEKALLTQCQQFIGTPVYMSPEQAGRGGLDIDTRTDIYSLGVLLYELLAGQTPFDRRKLLEGGYEEVIRTLQLTDPVRPSIRLSTLEAPELAAIAARCRQSDSSRFVRLVRGDLDWIVMKCLEKDRIRRYATVNGLATDLTRHLQREPVLARPPTSLYRLQKLVRRNQAVFLAASSAILVLLIGLVASLWLVMLERDALKRAVAAEREQSRLREVADLEKRKATDRLWEAYLAQGRAIRHSGQPERRFQALETLGKAALIRPSLELRNEAIACLALTDMRVGKHLVREQESQPFAAVDYQYARYAVADNSGNITVRKFSDDAIVARLPGFGFHGVFLRFSGDGRFLATKYDDRHEPGHNVARVWELATAQALLALTNTLADVALDFHPHLPEVAVGSRDGAIWFYDLAAAKPASFLPTDGRPHAIRFSPDGRSLAISFGSAGLVSIFNVGDGSISRVLPHPGPTYDLDWHPDGQLLAVACDDHRLYLWHLPSGQKRATLIGHKGQVVHTAFSPDGDLLASAGWDSLVSLWDPHAEELLAQAPGKGTVHFGGQNRWLAVSAQGVNLRVLECARNQVYQPLCSPIKSAVHQAAFSPDGRLLAVVTEQGIGLWDSHQRMQAGWIELAEARTAQFTPESGGLITLGHSPNGFEIWPIGSAPGKTRELNLGPPARFELPHSAEQLCLIPGTQKVVISSDKACQMVDLENPAERLALPGAARAPYLAASPDGKWIAAGPNQGHELVIWDVSSGMRLRTIPWNGSLGVVFSPDGRWLATASPGEYCLRDTGTWEPRSRFSAEPGAGWASMAFSPDGRILAMKKSSVAMQLVEPDSGRELAVLPGETPYPLCFSPDSERLAVANNGTGIRLWDLRTLRADLAKLNLDWDFPPYSRAGSNVPAPPLHVTVVCRE